MKGRRRPVKAAPLHSPTTQGAAFSHLQPFRERQASWSLPSSSTLVIVSISLSRQKGMPWPPEGSTHPLAEPRPRPPPPPASSCSWGVLLGGVSLPQPCMGPSASQSLTDPPPRLGFPLPSLHQREMWAQKFHHPPPNSQTRGSENLLQRVGFWSKRPEHKSLITEPLGNQDRA